MPANPIALSTIEYHVLLALADGPLHGYALKDAVATESAGTLVLRAGSLYRVIARLMGMGWVVETEPEGGPTPHPGVARRYYALSARGRNALSAEAQRLAQASALARKRLDVARDRP